MLDAGALREDVLDALYMQRALELAERGWGRVHPNPLVGAVLVRDGAVVGEGWHAEYGGPHAEVVALREAGDAARGATLYVTLEPCAHHGKTPPCADAVIAAGVRRVVYGAADPNLVAAGGAGRLEAAGVQVVGGVGRDEVRRQNAMFFHAVERARPFVALKLALSLDARLSAKQGAPTRVTGAEAEREVHRLRAGFDAVLIGSGTARSDDPLLTVRGPVSPRVAPIRIVADSTASLSADSRLVATARDVPVWLLTGPGTDPQRTAALEAAGVRRLEVAAGERGIELSAALDVLWSEGVRSIFCEGGGRLGAALLADDLVERLWLFYAPRIFGSSGTPAFPDVRPGAADAWAMTAIQPMGGDVMLQLDRQRD